jgi:hypothetical protein
MKPIFKGVVTMMMSSLLTACASTPNERDMNFTASALTKLSAAVDVTVRFNRSSENLSDSELLRLSASDDQSLLIPFEHYTVRVLRSGLRSVVLVCEHDGGKALLEDAGCTAKLDRYHWQTVPVTACNFTLDVIAVCGP